MIKFLVWLAIGLWVYPQAADYVHAWRERL